LFGTKKQKTEKRKKKYRKQVGVKCQNRGIEKHGKQSKEVFGTHE
jgi:hypothetical protein